MLFCARSIWGTGQDQCATIKRQLSLLMPGVSIFLDVDDLESIDALEEYIDGSQAVLGVRLLWERDSQKQIISYVQLMWRSQVIMIFVSQGYFKSGNCLREARASVAKSKPLSLVYDPVRGGAPLQTIREEECPTDLLGPIFDGRNVIEWHRIKVPAPALPYWQYSRSL